MNQIDHDTVRVECFDDFCRLSCKHRLFGFLPGSHDFKSVILQCRNRKIHPFRVQVNISSKFHSLIHITCNSFCLVKRLQKFLAFQWKRENLSSPLIKASCAPGMKTAFGTEDVPAEVALKQGWFQIFLIQGGEFYLIFFKFYFEIIKSDQMRNNSLWTIWCSRSCRRC